MARIDKEVFIQNIKDTTTVLQQLRVCIEQIEEVIDEYVDEEEIQQLTETVSGISDALTAHKNNKNNPHEVTKSQVGLGNVDNTSDANKPISTATQTALDTKADKSVVNAHIGNNSNPHNVNKSQVGLGNVDNTSDANKPISNATQTALSYKQDTLISGTNIKTINNESLLGSGNINISGGSTLYRHIITISSVYTSVSLNIINTSNTPYTHQTFYNFLLTNGFDDNGLDDFYDCSGIYDKTDTSLKLPIYNIQGTSDGSLGDYYFNDGDWDETLTTFFDKVIQIS